MSEISLELTTSIAPAKKFTVDGDEYLLLGVDHLTPEQENKVMALFARHALLLAEQEQTSHLGKGEAIAGRVRQCRLSLISTLTNLPQDIAGRLPLTQQARLMETLQEEMNSEDDDPVTAPESGDGAE